MKRVLGVLGVGFCLAVTASVPPVSAGDGRIIAYLFGANERPGPGDPDAVGRAYITIDDANNRLCLTLQYANVDGTLSGLHIHLAAPDSPGPIVVPFATPTQQVNGVFTQCVTNTESQEALFDNIAANPSQYYINLHSTPNYGPGALRGQLQAA
jgi:hypothetical protein